MTTLAAFLAARMDERQSRGPTDRWTPAEIDAVRQVIAMYEAARAPRPKGQFRFRFRDLEHVGGTARHVALGQVMLALARPYAGHEDYEQGWQR